MAKTYLNRRAEDCRRLASEECDLDLVAALQQLERDYRLKARLAQASCRSH